MSGGGAGAGADGRRGAAAERGDGDGDGHGCARCWPADADAAWAARGGLVHELVLVDEAHFIVALLRCPACHQRFLSVFAETIDWAGGEDPQYRQRLPVTPAEIVQLAAAGASIEALFPRLGAGRRGLHRDWPAGGEPVCGWQRGLRIAPHD